MPIPSDVLARFQASQEAAPARPAPSRSGPAEWLRSVLPVAEAVADEYGLPVEGVLAQAALESGYGKHAPGNNLFGIKSHGKGGQSQRTQEFIDGRMQTVTDSFRDYGDVGESFRDYGEFIHRNPRYRSALDQGDPEAYVTEIARAGYATDPAYADKLISIIRGPAMREALGDRPARPQRARTPGGIPDDVLERFQAAQGAAQAAPPEDPYLALLRRRQAAVPAAEEDSQFTKGLKAGAIQLKGLAQGLGALASDFIGQDAWRDSLLSDYQATMARAAEHGGRTMDIFEADSGADVLDWAAYWAGNLAPMMASSIVSGGLGAFAARKLATGAVERALVRKTAELTAQGIGKEAAKKQALEFASKALTQATARGAVAGSATASVGLESASIYGDIHEQTGEHRPGTAVAFGLPAGLLDVVPELGIIGRLAGNANADGIIKSLFKQAGKEASTEAGQTAIERSAVQSVDPALRAFSEEGLREIANAGAVGLLGGAVAGGVTRPFSGAGRQAPETAPEIEGDQLDQQLDEAGVQPEPVPEPTGLSDAEISAARSRLDAERGTQMVPVPERRGFREAEARGFQGGLLSGPPAATILEGEVLPAQALEGPRPVSPFFGDDQLNQLIHAERPAGLLSRQRFHLANPTPSLPAPQESEDASLPPPAGARTLRPFARRNLASGVPGQDQEAYGAPGGLDERPELSRPTAQSSPEIAQAQAQRAAAERRAVEEELAYLQATRPTNPALAGQMEQAKARLAEAQEAERVAQRQARTLAEGVPGEGRSPQRPEGLPYGSRLYRPQAAPTPQGDIIAPARRASRPDQAAVTDLQSQRESERFRRIQAEGPRTEADRAFARDYAKRMDRPVPKLALPTQRPQKAPAPQPQETSDEAQAQAQAAPVLSQAAPAWQDVHRPVEKGQPYPKGLHVEGRLRDGTEFIGTVDADAQPGEPVTINAAGGQRVRVPAEAIERQSFVNESPRSADKARNERFLRSNGTPYPTRKSAEAGITSRTRRGGTAPGSRDSYRVVEVDGGFAIAYSEQGLARLENADDSLVRGSGFANVLRDDIAGVEARLRQSTAGWTVSVRREAGPDVAEQTFPSREAALAYAEEAITQGETASTLESRLDASVPWSQRSPVPADRKLYLCACSASKRDGAPRPAVDLYTGAYFQSLGKTAPERRPDTIIISAKHGVLGGDEVIAPYDQRMTPGRVAELAADPAQRKRFRELIKGHDYRDILIAAGADYRPLIEALAADLPEGANVNMASGGIGTQKGQIKDWLAHTKPRTPAAPTTEAVGQAEAPAPQAGAVALATRERNVALPTQRPQKAPAPQPQETSDEAQAQAQAAPVLSQAAQEREDDGYRDALSGADAKIGSLERDPDYTAGYERGRTERDASNQALHKLGKDIERHWGAQDLEDAQGRRKLEARIAEIDDHLTGKRQDKPEALLRAVRRDGVKPTKTHQSIAKKLARETNAPVAIVLAEDEGGVPQGIGFLSLPNGSEKRERMLGIHIEDHIAGAGGRHLKLLGVQAPPAVKAPKQEPAQAEGAQPATPGAPTTEAVEQAEAPAPRVPPKPKKSAGTRFAEAAQVRPEDTILTAISRLGGLDRAEAEAQGVDPAHFALRPVFGRPVFRKSGGLSFDAMAESLSQHGYFEGEVGPNTLLDKLDQEFRGEPVRSAAGVELDAEAQAQEREAEADPLDPLEITADELEASGYNDIEPDADKAVADLRASAAIALGSDQAEDIAQDIAARFSEASDAEYIDALRSAYDDAITREAGEGVGGGSQDGSRVSPSEGEEDPLLASYDEAELAAREDEVAAAAARRDAQRQAEAERAQADRERDDFSLTGSTRTADANPGQADLIDATGRPRSTGGGAASAAVRAEGAQDDVEIRHSQRARATTRGPTRGVDRRTVDQVVLKFQTEFRKGASDLRFMVYEKQADVPWMRNLEPGTRVKASVSSTGIVTLVAENLDSRADVYAQLRHEVIAHVGLPRLLGEARWHEILDDVAAAEGRDEVMSAVYAEVRHDYPELDGRALADEVLARIAERTQAPVGAFREILAKLIRFLRKVGFWTQPLSVREAQALLTESARNLRRTPPRDPKGRFLGKGQRQAVAWHGTAADFDRFDLHQINTGEGSQQFGWGMYFASNRAVAEFYRDKLKAPGSSGRLYKVDIAPKHADYLDWDAFLSDLAPATQARIERLIAEEDIPGPGLNQLGQVFYQRLQGGGRGPEGASRLLAEYGIPGIAYLDQGSRDAIDGRGTNTYNYVVFDDRVVSILDRFSKRREGEARAPADLDAKTRRSAVEWLSDLSADTRRHWLGTLTRQQVVELGADILPAAKSWERTAQRMDADKTAAMVAAGEIAQRWGTLARKSPKVAERLADLMHEATIAGIDPSQKIRTDDNPDAYRKLKARFALLPEEAQGLFGEVRDAYEQRWKATYATMKARVERSEAGAEAKRAMLTKLRIHFESSRVRGPYFPLARFGDYWVRLTKDGADPEFAMFESSKEQREFMGSARVRGLEAKGWKVDSGKSMKNLAAASGPKAAFVADLHDVVDGLADGDQARALKDGIYQLYLESLPELSVRKHAMHRANRAGFSKDALRAFASQMWHGANQIARLKHGDVLADGITSMRDTAAGLGKREDRNRAADIVKELDGRLDWMMNPTTAQWSSNLTSLGFVYYLGVSPAAALVNLTQTAIVALPVLSSKVWGAKPIGAAKAARALTAGLRDYTASRFSDAARKKLEGEHGGDLGRALREAEESGILEKTLAHSLAGLSESEASVYREGQARVMGIVSQLFHESERANRESGFIAAYRLARDAGQAHEAAIEAAGDFVLESHFDYSGANRARFMQGNAARVLLLFRQYSQNMTYLLWRNFYLATKGEKLEVRRAARTKLFGVLGMTGVFAGAAGMPLMGVAYTVANLAAAAFGDEDDPWDAELAWRQFLAESLPDGWGKVAAKGPVNALTGLDLSSRTSLNELWVRSPYRDLEHKAQVGYWLEQAAGPVAGIALNIGRAADLLSEGKTWRATETAMPKFAKDVMKAWRYSEEGALNLKGDPVLERSALGPWNQLWQAGGLSPAELNERYDQNSALKTLEGKLLDRRRALINAWVMARTEGDRSGMSEVREAIRRFNRANREVAIGSDTLSRSLAGRARSSRESRDGTRFDARLRQRIEGETYLEG